MNTVGHGTCGTCRFSVPAIDPGGKIDFTQRFCRHSPPIPMVLPGPKGIVFKSVWPTLSPSDGCWQHEYPAQAEPLLPGERNKPLEEKPS